MAASKDIIEVVDEAILTSYSNHSRQDTKQISPIILEIVKQLLASLMGGCITKGRSFEEMKDQTKRPLFRVAVRMEMRHSGYMQRSDSEQILDTTVDVAKKATVDQMSEYNNAINFVV